MKKRILIVFLTMLFIMTGCRPAVPGSEDNVLQEQKTAVLYFANSDGTDLTAVSLNVEGKSREALPGHIMEMLLAGPEEEGLTPSVRSGTKLLSVTAEQGLASVDLSKEFYNVEGIRDVLAMTAIVKSLCSVKGIDRVMLTVEGQPLKNSAGEDQGVLKETDVVFDADALARDESNVTLYFSDLNAEYLVKEIRRIRIPRGESMEKLVVTELVRGPQSQTAAGIIPPETKILSVETKDAVCFVNLSEEFITKNNVGTAAERLTIFSIVNSLTELSNVDKVQFLVEGEKKDVYQHMMLNEPIARDISMIQK